MKSPLLFAGLTIASLAFAGLHVLADDAVDQVNPDEVAFGRRLALQQEPKIDRDDEVVKASVEKGLKFLVSIQGDNGAWHNDVGLKQGIGYGAYRVEASNQDHVGVTALACMALIAGGHTPESGEYSKNVRAGVQFIVKNIDNFGQVRANGTRMYSHAFASLLLAEVYGVTRDVEIGQALRDAVAFIARNQVGATINKGGWRYNPGQQDADMSITVCQLQALRAARNAGVSVKQSVIDAAREYIALNYDASDGGFMYQPSQMTGRVTFPLTAAGVVALQSAGNYESFTSANGREIDLTRSFKFLLATRPDLRRNFRPEYGCDFGFWYGHYYAAQAIRQLANTSPEVWLRWNRMNREHFVRWQQPNGAWVDEIGGEDATRNAYATAMACLILSIPNDYLPIFQH